VRNSLETTSIILILPKRETLMPEEPPPRRLTLEIDRKDELIIVRCHGQLVSGLTDTLYSNVRPLIPVTKRIVLDLSDLTWMDSMGLGTLVALYTSAKAAGCELQLLNIGKRIKELLGLTHLLDVFGVIGEHGVRL
jgi:anti-sigma B factor antagonist